MNSFAGVNDAEVLGSAVGAKGPERFDSCGGTIFESMTDLLTVVAYQAIKGPAFGRQQGVTMLMLLLEVACRVAEDP